MLFTSLERFRSVDVENGLAWAIWPFAAQVKTKRKARSQTGCRNPSLGLTTKAKGGCKVAGQEEAQESLCMLLGGIVRKCDVIKLQVLNFWPVQEDINSTQKEVTCLEEGRCFFDH
jgi:hypothetical protein